MSPDRAIDTAIIGAGPAGSLAAARLVARGRSVVVLERDHFPRPAVGESLLPICNDLLEEAGLLDVVKAADFMVKRGATFLREDVRERFDFGDALAGDAPDTFQVPRDEFDQLLATEAARLGADVRFGHEVVDARFDDDGGVLSVVDRASERRFELRARFVLDCSGPGRVLPRLLDLMAPIEEAPRIGCITHVPAGRRPEGDEEGDIWVCCHPDDGWLWIIPFSNGRTSVGFVGDAKLWDALPGDDSARLASRLAGEPNAAARLGELRPLWTPRTIRNYPTAVSRMHGPGWALVGHTGEFIDPVLSSGVALSLDAARRASELVHRSLAGESVDWARDYAQVMERSAAVFRAFVERWYNGTLTTIFFQADKPARIRRRISSILAGYTLRDDNPLARDPGDALDTIVRYCTGGTDARRG